MGGLARAFRETAYRAAGLSLRPGRRCPQAMALLRRLGGREGAFVTACNPMARRQSPGWNDRAQLRLRQAARRWPVLPGISQPLRRLHAGWQEAQWLTVAPRPVSVRLARRFRQRAILAIGRDGMARIVWINV
jgi:hypothetical protein